MQSAARSLRLNRRHPDAAGCFLALPMVEGGGTVVRNAAARGIRGLGEMAWSGTPTWGNMPGGRCITVTSTTNFIVTSASGSVWAKDFTMMATILPSTITGLAQCILLCGGAAFEVTATTGVLRLTQDGVAVRGSAAVVPAIAANTMYRVGVRYRASDNNIGFFNNGRMESVAGSGAVVPSVTFVNTVSSSNGSTITGKMRDIRMWDRFMPDAAFKRYYTNPNAFYTDGTAASRIKGVVSVGLGRFLPFMHPSLQS